jgi:DNA ligase (NAD+)
MYSNTEQRRLNEVSKELLKAPQPMFEEDAKTQLDQLHEILKYHEWRYAQLNNPVISDFEYDMLYKKLQQLEQQFPQLLSSDSPTQRVANDLTESFDAAPHLTPMLSLENSYNAEDLNDFDAQVRKLALVPEGDDIEYCVEPKFDGGTIALVYENDQLVRGATRGNGTIGEEITNNARAMRSIPIKAAFSKYGLQKVELRGEALIRKDVFDKVNIQREEDGLALFANPRNAATGAFKVKDAREIEKRGLEAFVYQLGYAVDANGDSKLSSFNTHHESIELLGTLGFKIAQQETKVCKNIQEVSAFCDEWQAKRDTYGYEIDGMVIKVNQLAIQERCGYTSHHPRWAIAFKFKAKQATTKLLGIDFQVGKVGSVTPVAKLDPVQLAGVTVSSVSLHNEEFIRSKDIRIGDTVLVERAGDVIPYIVKVMEDLRDGSEMPLEFPKNCPACNSVLVKAETEAAWRCENDDCTAKIVQKMIFHVSKDAMDIEGFGKSIVERFYDAGYLKSLADMYRLDYDMLSTIDGFGKKSAENLRQSIDKAKQKPIHRLLHSLSVHHLGRKVSKLIAAEISHVLDLKTWEVDRFTQIKDVGPVVAENVIKYFSDPSNVALLEELESLGVNLTQTDEDRPKQVSEDAILAGKTILFTGTLYKMGRKEAQEKAESLGAKNISAVSSNLNILVVGAEAGSKLKKAQALGTVQVLTEDEFLELIAK